MTDTEAENFYREHLEEDIIFYLAKNNDLPLEKAMDLYYKSDLAKLIYKGKFGIQYLDYKILAEKVWQ